MKAWLVLANLGFTIILEYSIGEIEAYAQANHEEESKTVNASRSSAKSHKSRARKTQRNRPYDDNERVSAWLDLPKIMPTFFNKFSENEKNYVSQHTEKKTKRSKTKVRTTDIDRATTDIQSARQMIEIEDNNEILEKLQDKYTKRKTHK